MATPSGGAVTPPDLALQIPQQDERSIQPPPGPPPEPQPKGAGFMGTGGKVADVAANFLQGWMKGRERSAVAAQQAADREVAQARANMSVAWDAWSKAAQDPSIPAIKAKLQGQAQAGSAIQPLLQKFLTGKPLAADEQKQIDDLQQHALTPQEQETLHNYQQGQNAWLGAAGAFSQTTRKYVAPNPEDQPRGAKGVLKRVGQQVAGKQQPQMFGQQAVDTWDKIYPTLKPPEASTVDQARNMEAGEFVKNAPVREQEAANQKAVVDAQANLNKVVTDPNASTDDVKRAQDQLEAAKGKVKSPSEQLNDTLAQTGISALNKAQQGIPQKDWTDAERSFYNKTFPKDVPQNMWDFFMQRAERGDTFTDKTGKTRPYTQQDGLNDYMAFEARMKAVERGPNATQELINELTTLSKTINPNFTPAQRAQWIAERLRPSPEDKEGAKSEKPLPEEAANRLSSSSLFSVVSEHPELGYLVGWDPGTKTYTWNAAPSTDIPSGHWYQGDTQRRPEQMDADRQRLKMEWAKALQDRGAPASFIQQTTGIDVRQMAPPPAAETPGPQSQPSGMTPPPTGAPAAQGMAPPPGGQQSPPGRPAYKIGDPLVGKDGKSKGYFWGWTPDGKIKAGPTPQPPQGQ